MNQKAFGVNPSPHQTVEIFRKKIENYSFLMNDRIGKGFSSIVYRGLNDLTNQVVAIKVIDLKSLKDDIARNMLDSELECIKSLNHTNLLKCYDSFNTVNNCYIITEYCNEGDLASKIKSRGKYTEEEFKSLFKQLFQGYSKLSEKGYIHRDLKPANILLKDGVLKIADFGFVKKLTSSPKESYNVGTPLYMSPEAMKDNIYTTKNDIWSMGVMCYELLAGKAPWDCRNEAELKQKVARNNIRFDSVNISSELQDLIFKCIDLDENKRISLQEIQRHPWVRKVLNPSPQIDNPFNQIQNLRSIIDQAKPQQKYSFVPVKNASFFSDQNPQNALPSPSQIKNMKILDVLVSMLNYCRFNYRLQKKLWECSMRHYQIEELVSFLNSDLLSKMNVHEHIIRTKENVLKAKDWYLFTKSSNWLKYENVVEAYAKKYDTAGIQQRLDGSLKTALKSFIRDMNLMMQINQQDRQNERNIVVLDYMVTYYMLAQLWDKCTGNFEAFAAFESFAAESHLEQILCGRIEEERLNKLVVYNSIKHKIACLKI